MGVGECCGGFVYGLDIILLMAIDGEARVGL